jgi:non-homologous end joining protein Ku
MPVPQFFIPDACWVDLDPEDQEKLKGEYRWVVSPDATVEIGAWDPEQFKTFWENKVKDYIKKKKRAQRQEQEKKANRPKKEQELQNRMDMIAGWDDGRE